MMNFTGDDVLATYCLDMCNTDNFYAFVTDGDDSFYLENEQVEEMWTYYLPTQFSTLAPVFYSNDTEPESTCETYCDDGYCYMYCDYGTFTWEETPDCTNAVDPETCFTFPAEVLIPDYAGMDYNITYCFNPCDTTVY